MQCASGSIRSALDNKQSSTIGIFQAPGSNQLALAHAIEAKMRELKQDFPPGLDYDIAYNTTTVVEESIADVVRTLLIAIGLVAIVVVVFLQTWRASLIPLAAVAGSNHGTVTVLVISGFAINTLTLFGLVPPVGIAVDDAIVVL